jgi:hypothetical protein
MVMAERGIGRNVAAPGRRSAMFEAGRPAVTQGTTYSDFGVSGLSDIGLAKRLPASLSEAMAERLLEHTNGRAGMSISRRDQEVMK